MKQSQRQSGAVSLFIVIFTALLITIIVVSFVRLMIRDQQQATATDLSQSAYDSAQAGVEDAKRVLLRYGYECSSEGSAVKCAELNDIFNNQPCSTIFDAIGIGSATETIIQQSGTDDTLDQAYTCVKIQLNTNDYLGQLAAEESKLIQLVGEGSFDTVRLSWFSFQDFSSSTSDRSIYLGSGSSYPLPKVGIVNWKINQPSVVRAQLIQTSSSGFTLTDFDNGDVAMNNARSLTLYPFSVGLNDAIFTIDDNSRSPLVSLTGVDCRDEINSGGYACTVDLQLPDPIDGDANSRNAFLRLAAHYNPSHYKLELYKSGTLVKFKGVQPSVDSTGRANDYFRRVESRIEMQDTSFPYPEATVDLEGSLCKDFRITDNPLDYTSTCTP